MSLSLLTTSALCDRMHGGDLADIAALISTFQILLHHCWCPCHHHPYLHLHPQPFRQCYSQAVNLHRLHYLPTIIVPFMCRWTSVDALIPTSTSWSRLCIISFEFAYPPFTCTTPTFMALTLSPNNWKYFVSLSWNASRSKSTHSFITLYIYHWRSSN